MSPPVISNVTHNVALSSTERSEVKSKKSSWEHDDKIEDELERQSSAAIEIDQSSPKGTKRPRSDSNICEPASHSSLFTSSTESELEADSSLESSSVEDQCFICLDSFSDPAEPKTPLPCTNQRCQDTPVHAKCIYEWKQINTKISVCRSGAKLKKVIHSSCPLCRSQLAEFDYFPPEVINSSSFSDLKERRKFLYQPVPREAGFVKCFLKLNHVPNNTSTQRDLKVYELYLQAPTTLSYPMGPIPDAMSPSPGDKLLATGNRTRYQKGTTVGKSVLSPPSQIDLYMTDKDYKAAAVSSAETYFGTVKSSLSGFKHEVVIPCEANSKRCTGRVPTSKGFMNYQEVCCVHFVQNKTGKNSSVPGPRKIQVCLPKVEESSEEASDNTKSSDNLESPAEALKPNPGRLSHALTYKSLNMTYNHANKFTFGRNKDPYWLESIQAYSLDFKGRVTMPSNKNFQLLLDSEDIAQTDGEAPVHPENHSSNFFGDILRNQDEKEVSLQFGKVGEFENSEIFSMDFRYPLSPIQAFGICIGSCDRNINVVR